MGDVVGNIPGRHCSPRHRMPCNSKTRVRNALDDVAGSIYLASPLVVLGRRCWRQSAEGWWIPPGTATRAGAATPSTRQLGPGTYGSPCLNDYYLVLS